MELVTGHGASEHITAAQVSRLIQGVTVMDDTTVYRLNVGNDCAIGVNGLTVGISTGEMVLHGYHTTFEDVETLTLDPTLDAAKSRIDKLCLIISEDLTTGIQSAYIQVVQGTEATTPTAPATPSTPTSPTELYMGVGVIATVTVSDTVIASYVDNTDLYAGSFVTLNELETNMSNIAPIEKTSTASKAYAIGDNLIYNGILYKVDAAIAQGATLVPSGNISLSPDIEAQITSLRSSLSDLNHVFMSNDLNYQDLQQSIPQNSSYTVPKDGMYILTAVGDDNSSASFYLNSLRTRIILANQNKYGISVTIPLKKDTVIYTRANYGTYIVNGYYHWD